MKRLSITVCDALLSSSFLQQVYCWCYFLSNTCVQLLLLGIQSPKVRPSTYHLEIYHDHCGQKLLVPGERFDGLISR